MHASAPCFWASPPCLTSSLASPRRWGLVRQRPRPRSAPGAFSLELRPTPLKARRARMGGQGRSTGRARRRFGKQRTCSRCVVHGGSEGLTLALLAHSLPSPPPPLFLRQRLPVVPDAATGLVHFHALLHALVERASERPALGAPTDAVGISTTGRSDGGDGDAAQGTQAAPGATRPRRLSTAVGLHVVSACIRMQRRWKQNRRRRLEAAARAAAEPGGAFGLRAAASGSTPHAVDASEEEEGVVLDVSGVELSEDGPGPGTPPLDDSTAELNPLSMLRSPAAAEVTGAEDEGEEGAAGAFSSALPGSTGPGGGAGGAATAAARDPRHSLLLRRRLLVDSHAFPTASSDSSSSSSDETGSVADEPERAPATVRSPESEEGEGAS